MRMLAIVFLAALVAVSCGGREAVKPPGGNTAGSGGSGGTGGSGGSGGDDGGSGGGGRGPISSCQRYSNDVKIDEGLYESELIAEEKGVGEPFLDPIFGTRMVRLTATDQGTCKTPEYGQSAISVDRKHVMVWCGDGETYQPRLIGIDPVTLTLTDAGITLVPPDGSFTPAAEDAWFSGVNPSYIFAREPSQNHILRWYIGGRYALISPGLSAEIEEGERLEQLSVSADDKVFALALVDDATDAVKGYVVYFADTKEVKKELVEKLARVRIDRSGRYLFLAFDDVGPSDPNARVIDLENDTVTDIKEVPPGSAPRFDSFGLGAGVEAGWNVFGNEIHVRSLASPAEAPPVIELGPPHRSIGVAMSDAPYAILSFQGTPNTPYANELVLLPTGGDDRVYRLAHHRATSNPHASVSPDGCLAAFTAKMFSTGTDHVYLLVVPAL